VNEPYRIEPLAKQHDRKAFRSGSPELDRYFERQVGQDERRDLTACFVAIDITHDAVAGYYTLSATSVSLNDLPEEIIRKLPGYPEVPAALLGRLAIHEEHQSRGLGGALLFDALKRAMNTDLAVHAMVVDAKDDAAQDFYEHHGFTVLALEQRRCLFLPMATARKLMAR
jgi:ribosomal protein S18 acetylase RimI-like enzyme